MADGPDPYALAEHGITKSLLDMTKVPTLDILFNATMRHSELPLFRGAVIKALPHDSVLFHNHLGEGLRYGYPLIQYKTIKGKAAIICIGKGTESVWDFFAGSNFDLTLGSRKVVAAVDAVNDVSTDITIADAVCHKYSIQSWLPFNQSNYHQFKTTESLTKKIEMLNRILTGNILTMLKGVDIMLSDRLIVEIMSISEPKPVRYKNIKVLSLDATFQSNVSIPEHIGLGKHASLGFGTVTNLKHETKL